MKRTKPTNSAVVEKIPTVGARSIEGLEEAIAWSKGEAITVRVSHVQVPNVDVWKVRRQMGSVRHSSSGYTDKSVLLAVIAKHPESVEDVLKDVR